MGESRVQGTKQHSKPMMIKKKKFMMAAPDPTQSGIRNQPLGNSRDQTTSVLKRDGSMNKLVNEKHLGPSALKDRKPLENWPTESKTNSGTNSKMAMNTPLKNPNKKAMPPYMQKHEDDEDYEEGFEEGAEDGEDEMERLRKAMAKEKEKAQ